MLGLCLPLGLSTSGYLGNLCSSMPRAHMMTPGPEELQVAPSLLLPVSVPALAHLVLGFSSKRRSPATLPLLSEFTAELNWLAPAWHCVSACCAVQISLWLAVTSPAIYFRCFELKKIPTVHGQEHRVKPEERWTQCDAAEAPRGFPSCEV